MNRAFACIAAALVSWPGLAGASDEARVFIAPKILQDMLRTSDAHSKVRKRELVSAGAIPIPAAIAFDSKGCFAGFYAAKELDAIKFDCIPETDRLALSKVLPERDSTDPATSVVLELIPGFAMGRCADCNTMADDLRDTLESKRIKAEIVPIDIGY